MNDAEFLSYAEEHAKTERALFSAEHCRRLYALADVAFPEPNLPSSAFRSMRGVSRLVDKARRRLSCVRYDVCESGRTRTLSA